MTNDPTPWDEINFTCWSCGAKPGEACHNKRGGRAPFHSPRIKAADRVWAALHEQHAIDTLPAPIPAFPVRFR